MRIAQPLPLGLGVCLPRIIPKGFVQGEWACSSVVERYIRIAEMRVQFSPGPPRLEILQKSYQ